MENSQQDAINTLFFNHLNPETFILKPLSNNIYILFDSNNDQWTFMIRKQYGKLYLLAKNNFMKKYQEIHSFKLR